MAKATKVIAMTHRTKAVRKGERKLINALKRKLKALGAKAAEVAVANVPDRVLGKADDNGEAERIAANAAAQASDALDWGLLINATEEELAAVVLDGAREALLRIGITDEGIVDQVFEQARDWAHERSAELVGMRYNDVGDLVDNPNAAFRITDDVREEIADKVKEAISEGWSAGDLADEIEGLGPFSEARAETIARTEIIRANNEGHLVAFRESGVVQQKQWSTAEDGDVCDICIENEEQGPIDLNDAFASGDDAAPAHPNCRCTIVAVIEDEAPEADTQGSA